MRPIATVIRTAIDPRLTAIGVLLERDGATTLAATFCKLLVIGFGVLYAVAMLGWAWGTFGWLGWQDPLSGVFLVLIGQPWVRFVDVLPVDLWIPGLLLAPLVNLGIMKLACDFLLRRKAPQHGDRDG